MAMPMTHRSSLSFTPAKGQRWVVDRKDKMIQYTGHKEETDGRGGLTLIL